MKILITGCKGQLGHALISILDDQKSEIGPIPALYRQAQVTGVDIDVLDIADFDAVQAFFRQNSFDLIINCAAMTNVDGCETERDAAFRVNALGAKNLAMAAAQMDAKLVHVSTDYVFAGNGKEPYSEWDLCDPQSVYGKSKYLGEQYVRECCPKYFIVRTAWLYGYVGKNFVKTILRIAGEREEITVVNDQRGNPTNAVDLAHHILKMAAAEQYGVYHCTGTGECTWYDFACKIVECAGMGCKVIPVTSGQYKQAAKRPSYSSLDNQMLRCTVGDEMRDWQEALQCYFKNINLIQ